MAYSLVTGALITDMFPWDATAGSNFIVIDLASGKVVANIPGPPFFAFNYLNAYEQADGSIIIDCGAFDNADFLAHMTVENLRSKDPDIEGGYIRRFELNVAARTCGDVYGRVKEMNISTISHHPVCCSLSVAPAAVGLPRINDAYLGKQHRYIWAAELTREDGFRGIVKFDMDTRATTFWRDTQAAAGEPIFVPRDPHSTDSASEDDGVLLVAVLDLAEKRTYLLVLEARSLKELCRAYAPVHMPLSFHGIFIA
jgi:carotenoid cleavage dioxygenase-like enzyme